MSIRRTLSDMFDPPSPPSPDPPWIPDGAMSELLQIQHDAMQENLTRLCWADYRGGLRKRADYARSLKPRPMEPR